MNQQLIMKWTRGGPFPQLTLPPLSQLPHRQFALKYGCCSRWPLFPSQPILYISTSSPCLCLEMIGSIVDHESSPMQLEASRKTTTTSSRVGFGWNSFGSGLANAWRCTRLALHQRNLCFPDKDLRCSKGRQTTGTLLKRRRRQRARWSPRRL
jgi:hypothetical protein